MNIPEGFGTVSPYFFVDGAEKFGDFLKSAFGGEEVGRTMRPDNVIANLQIRIGSSTIMISEASEHFPHMSSAYYLYVEDADASMTKALEAGGTSVMEVSDMDYGDRQGGIQDPFGNYWWISQRLVDEPYH